MQERTTYREMRHVPSTFHHPAHRLTMREFEVLCLIRDGQRYNQITRRLGIADATVSFHVKNLTGKLQANDRTDAVMIALRRGLLEI
jgi:DNA-binding NarL/FixJ family response regulator